MRLSGTRNSPGKQSCALDAQRPLKVTGSLQHLVEQILSKKVVEEDGPSTSTIPIAQLQERRHTGPRERSLEVL